MLDANTLTIIATVLGDAENLLAGKAVEVPVPSETVKVGVVTITTPPFSLSVSYTK